MTTLINKIWRIFVPSDVQGPDEIANSVSSCPANPEGRIHPACAKWAYDVAIFRDPGIMMIIYDYIDTFTAVDLPLVFPMLRIWADGLRWSIKEHKFVPSDDRMQYWNQRLEKFRLEYENKTGLPYAYDITCDVIQDGIHRFESNDFLEDMSGRSFFEDLDDNRMRKTHIPGIDVPSRAGHTDIGSFIDNMTTVQQMIVHEFYENHERNIFQFFPAKTGPLSKPGTLIRIRYFNSIRKRCDMEQIAYALEREDAREADAHQTDIIVGQSQDGPFYTFYLRGRDQGHDQLTVRGNYFSVRRFIHFVLPLIESIECKPAQSIGFKRIISAVLKENEFFTLYKFDRDDSNDAILDTRGIIRQKV